VRLDAHLAAPLDAERRSVRATLVSSEPAEPQPLVQFFTIWPRSPGDLVVAFDTFDSTDANGHAELRISLETRRAPLQPSDIRLDIDLLFRMRVLEASLPAGWTCDLREGAEWLACRIESLPAEGQRSTAVLKVHALQANQYASARLGWSDRGFPREERSFFEPFLVYVREQIVTNTNDSGPGSLRQAMLDASSGQCRAYVIPCRIRFDIPPPPDGQWLTIRPETPLPVIATFEVEQLTIDGTTQTARRDTNPLGPEIELDGSLLREGDGLNVRAPRATIKGLAIHSFPGSGIESGGGTTITGNYIGTDATGLVAHPNASRGITVAGWSTDIQNNVISGNHRSGVFALSGTASLRGNLIGVAADGVTPLPNGASGVFAGPAATMSIEGNTIAYNRHAGIGNVRPPLGTVINRPHVVARANRIFGNLFAAIDLDLDGPGTSSPVQPPAITSAVYDPFTDSTIIHGTLESRTDVGAYSYSIQVYANSTASTTGFGEGQRYLGSVLAAGSSFAFRARGNLKGQFVSAHLVRGWNWAEVSETVTSEFGNVMEVR
jgi:hypothetical protein